MKITKNARLASVIFVLLVVVSSAQAADDLIIERMATCQDSWLDWKNDPAGLKKLSASIRSSFLQKQGAPFLVPKSKQTVVGLPVVQLFPDNIGMAVGFSVIVDANFETTRKSLEKKIGKAFKKCETDDNMQSCELEIGEHKTITLMAEENVISKTTLIGCYYYYEK